MLAANVIVIIIRYHRTNLIELISGGFSFHFGLYNQLFRAQFQPLFCLITLVE